MKCFICSQKSELLIPDRDSDSQILRNICNTCLDSFLKVYPKILLNIRNRELGLSSQLSPKTSPIIPDHL